MALRHTVKASVLTALFMATACQSSAMAAPAVLASADAPTIEKVKAVLARAMNLARIDLGASDIEASSTLAVLPPPLSPSEDRSTVRPTLFDIVLKSSGCFVIRRDTGEAFALTGVECRPLD